MKSRFYFISIMLFVCINMHGQVTIADPFKFPVLPGSEKWKSFTTGKQMHEACQIPEEILKNMTVEALAETCFSYPLQFEYVAFNDERKGIKTVIERFNGLTELSKRTGGTNELIKLYKNIPTKIQSVIADDLPYKTAYIELLLADEAFINGLDQAGILKLQKEVLQNYKFKTSNTKIYSQYNIVRTVLLGSVIFEKLHKNNFKSNSTHVIVKDFITNYNTASPEQIKEITGILNW